MGGLLFFALVWPPRCAVKGLLSSASASPLARSPRCTEVGEGLLPASTSPAIWSPRRTKVGGNLLFAVALPPFAPVRSPLCTVGELVGRGCGSGFRSLVWRVLLPPAPTKSPLRTSEGLTPSVPLSSELVRLGTDDNTSGIMGGRRFPLMLLGFSQIRRRSANLVQFSSCSRSLSARRRFDDSADASCFLSVLADGRGFRLLDLFPASCKSPRSPKLTSTARERGCTYSLPGLLWELGWLL